MGYAFVSTDGGHTDGSRDMGDGSFGSDPQARADYNYLSTRRVTDAVRKIISVEFEIPKTALKTGRQAW